jgi:FixJ family two-component response regulator
MKPVVLLLADDAFAAEVSSTLVRERYAFQSFQLIDELLTATEGLDAAVVVNDLDQPERREADLVRTLANRGLGHWPVILLSEKTTVRKAVELMRTGIHDLIEKPVSPDRLRASLASAGVKLRSHRSASSKETAAYATLTPREREVGEHLASGSTTRQVADALGISVRTVDVYRGRIFRKLGVANVAALASLIAGLLRT